MSCYIGLLRNDFKLKLNVLYFFFNCLVVIAQERNVFEAINKS